MSRNTDHRDFGQRFLESRIEEINETFVMFADDMAHLFRRAESDTSDPKKILCLMHGVKKQLLVGLVRNPPRTVKDFIKEATAFAGSLQERCRHYDRVTSERRSHSHESQRPLRPIVRKQLRALWNRLFQTGVFICRQHHAPRYRAGVNTGSHGTALTSAPASDVSAVWL